MDKTPHSHPYAHNRASQALQRAEEERERRKADERRALENPPLHGVDLATHQATQRGFEAQHPPLHLGDINAEVNRFDQGQHVGPQISGFQPVNQPNSEGVHGHGHGQTHSPEPTPIAQHGVNPPGTPGPLPIMRVTPPMGYFTLPPERPKATRPPPTMPPMMPMALPSGPSTPVSQSVNSSQESSDALEEKPHNTFKQVTIHTAKCDVCNRHNKSTLHRCVDCGWQICTPCWDVRGGNGEHFPRRKFVGPTFGQSQAKKGKKIQTQSQVQQGQGQGQLHPNTPKTPSPHPHGRTRSTPVQTPVQSSPRRRRSYLGPARESQGHESDDTLSYTEDNDHPRPPTRGKGKAMGRVDEDGDVPMSGMPSPQLDSEEQRRIDAAIGLMMLSGRVPRGQPHFSPAPQQHYPHIPNLDRPAVDTHPNPRYQDLSARAAARFDALLAAAEQVLGSGSGSGVSQGAQVVQDTHHGEASHASLQGYASSQPFNQTLTATQPSHIQVPMGPPPPPTPQHHQSHHGHGHPDPDDDGHPPNMLPRQDPQGPATNQAHSNTGSHSGPGAKRGIPARAAAIRRILLASQHSEPLWTPEWFNTMTEHFIALQRAGLAPQDQTFTPLHIPPRPEPPGILPDAVYERRYDQWLTPESEARARAAAAILRGEVPLSTTGVPGFAPAGPSAAGHPLSASTGTETSTAPPNVDRQNASAGPSTAAPSIFGGGTTTAPDQGESAVTPARRPPSDSFSTNPNDPKRQATAPNNDPAPVSAIQVPTPPINTDQAPMTQIPGLGGYNNDDATDVDPGPKRSVPSSRGRAWEL